MKNYEFPHIIIAIVTLTIVAGFSFIIKAQWNNLASAFAFSTIIIFISVMMKKLTANFLDANAEHELWQMQNFGFTKEFQLKKPIPVGIIFPLILSLFSLGLIKFPAILTYEAKALKYRASKRFGFYSFKEMTDWHHAIIGAASILTILLLALISYFLPYNLEYLSKLAIYYTFSNLLPISKLDGSQIFFGSRILWSVLFTITLIFLFFALTII